MAERLDGKFKGTIVKCKNNQLVPPDQYMIFLAKDNAFPATLRFYRDECERVGASPEQVKAADVMIERVEKWRAKYPDLCKTPDVLPGEIQFDDSGDRVENVPGVGPVAFKE